MIDVQTDAAGLAGSDPRPRGRAPSDDSRRAGRRRRRSPRRRGRAHAEGLVADRRRPTPSAILTVLNSLDELESAALRHPRTRHPRLARGQQRDDRVHGHGGVGVPGPRRAADGLARRPVPAWPDHRHRRAWRSPAFVALSGFAVNAFMLFLTRIGVGVAKSNTLSCTARCSPTQYPIGTRGRVNAVDAHHRTDRRHAQPAARRRRRRARRRRRPAGGGRSSSSPSRRPSPPGSRSAPRTASRPVREEGRHRRGHRGRSSRRRSRWKRRSPASCRSARSASAVFAFAALGFGLFTVPVVGNLFLEDEYGLGSFGRGVVGTVARRRGPGRAPVRRQVLRRPRTDGPDTKALRLLGLLILPTARAHRRCSSSCRTRAVRDLGDAPCGAAVGVVRLVGPCSSTVVPYRLRGMGAALGVDLHLLHRRHRRRRCSRRSSSTPSGPGSRCTAAHRAVVAGRRSCSCARARRFIKDDLADDRQPSSARRSPSTTASRLDAEPVPALQVSHVDFSYGPVQILFDVSFEVRKGEILALLGTNGAGKSTILRGDRRARHAVRGVVRHNGRSITYVAPEQRTRAGHPPAPGRQGRVRRHDRPGEPRDGDLEPPRRPRRPGPPHRARARRCSPSSPSARTSSAASLSGGEQQLLALAGVLACEPEILHDRRALPRPRPDHGRASRRGGRPAPTSGA